MTLPRVILGIETSCDETAAALMIDGQVKADRITRQLLHEKYGGVIPELASRAHEQLLSKAVEGVLKDSGIGFREIEAIAVTAGPGLAGALMVGVSYAKGLSVALNKPLWAVNHIEGHLWSPVIQFGEIPTPFLALIVSGGHTLLIYVKGFRDYVRIGQTLDDAAGELFDKVGRLIGFPFPSGPNIDRLALAFDGKPVKFPVSRTKHDPYAFSFSGLKTSIIQYLQKHYRQNDDKQFDLPEEDRSAICLGLMESVAKNLIRPIRLAIETRDVKNIVVAGGVSASRFLRREFQGLGEEFQIPVTIPPIHHCTDNGAMIANIGNLLITAGVPSSQLSFEVVPSAKIPGLSIQ